MLADNKEWDFEIGDLEILQTASLSGKNAIAEVGRIRLQPLRLIFRYTLPARWGAPGPREGLSPP